MPPLSVPSYTAQDDPATWESENWPAPQNKFLIARPAQTQQSYNNRTHPNLYRSYRTIYGERVPLLTYIDHWGIMRGTKDVRTRVLSCGGA